jgi:hypothetical protein
VRAGANTFAGDLHTYRIHVEIERMIESVQGPKRVLARIAGFDGAYMRFTGQVTIERTGRDTAAETVTAPGLWELMYFGKASG